MKNLVMIWLLLLTTYSYCQTKEKITLEWKLAKNDTLKYKTTMKESKEQLEQNDADTTSLFSGNEFQKLRESVADFNAGVRYETHLYPNKKNEKLIDIEMLMFNDLNSSPFARLKEEIKTTEADKKSKKKKNKNKDKIDETENDSIKFENLYKDIVSLKGNIALRGRISQSGEVVSTYYKNSQRNLIALLFELPNRKVEVGEKWQLNLNFIEMDQNFLCDNFSRENAVFIEQIIEKENDKIAVVKYNIQEYIDGDFESPLVGIFGMEANEKTFMKFSYIATANFSITKGKWITYDGEMIIESNFSPFSRKSKTEFKLVE
ncbi:hypothetical protein [Flavobacterium sp.]|uniref:hypothetical protein n=1 Tax=Flavobacterium sp. TaxID=239 RepID=UPI002613E132|nr:hypothetical protein [Flavobacterium sp.]